MNPWSYPPSQRSLNLPARCLGNADSNKKFQGPAARFTSTTSELKNPWQWHSLCDGYESTGRRPNSLYCNCLSAICGQISAADAQSTNQKMMCGPNFTLQAFGHKPIASFFYGRFVRSSAAFEGRGGTDTQVLVIWLLAAGTRSTERGRLYLCDIHNEDTCLLLLHIFTRNTITYGYLDKKWL